MTNNDLLRRLRYILNIKDTKIIKILSLVKYQVPLPRVTSWLKKEEDEDFTECSDKDLIAFLDGLIIEKRGKKEDSAPAKVQAPQRLSNNLIFLKLKIAFNLKSDDVLELLEMAEYNISSSELSAFFRKKTHRHYRVCKDQILRKFLKGLQLKYTTATVKSQIKQPTVKSAPTKPDLKNSTLKLSKNSPKKNSKDKFSW
jgi:uncharacterized protein YehS (DUF1456 family)